jgi:cobalamin synthase
MSRQHPTPARTDPSPELADHSPATIVAFAALAPLAVLALSAPLAAVAVVATLAVAWALGRSLAPRVSALADGRGTSLPVPGLGLRLRLEFGVAEK